MPALVHKNFRIHNAKQFFESFDELSHDRVAYLMRDTGAALSTYGTTELDPTHSATAMLRPSLLDTNIYLFIGKVSPWKPEDAIPYDINVNENNPPDPHDSIKYGNYDHWDDMIAAKKINHNEVSHVVKRERPDLIKLGVRQWEAGKYRYDEYDDRADDLDDDDKLIYCLNKKFRVYKCIRTGRGRWQTDLKGDGSNSSGWDYKSYEEPLSVNTSDGVSENFSGLLPDNTPRDGYQWKYMYTIAAGEALKFVTTSYIPVQRVRRDDGFFVDDGSHQYQIENNAVHGAIHSVLVDREANTTLGADSEGVPYSYDQLSGNNYFMLTANSATISWNSTTATIKFANNAIVNSDSLPANNVIVFPGSTANTVNGRAVDPNASSMLMNSNSWLHYGVTVIDNSANTALKDEWAGTHLHVIESGYNSGTSETTLTFDLADFKRKVPLSYQSVSTSPTTDFSNFKIELSPDVMIKSNWDSSTSLKTNSQMFTAKTLVERDENGYGRIFACEVLNPGKKHERIDECIATPTNSGDYIKGASHPTIEEASIHACLSPPGGHGFDAVHELFGHTVMVNSRLEGSEVGSFTVSNEFRKIGLLKNPLKADAQYMYANTSDDFFLNQKSDQCIRLDIKAANTPSNSANTSIPQNFENDTRVRFYKGGANVAYATVVDYDPNQRIMRVIEPRLDIDKVFDCQVESLNAHSITGNTTIATVEANTSNGYITYPDMKYGSGQILYLEGRSSVSRSQNQVEDVKISISF